MYLTSTLNPLSKSQGSVPVSIFSFGDRRKFLRVSKDYQDTLGKVIQSFDLDEDVLLALRTSTFDVCQGKEVEIDESAYPFLWTFLDNIDVSIVEPTQVTRHQQKRTKGKNRVLNPVDLELPSSPLKPDFENEHPPAIAHPEAPIDEGRSRIPITEDVDRGVGGSFQVADTMGEGLDHSQKSGKHTDDDDHKDDQLEGSQVSQETTVPLKTVEARPITGPEDHDEGGFKLQKKFRHAGNLVPKHPFDAIGSLTMVKKEVPAKPDNEIPTTTPPPNYPEIIKPSTSAPRPEEDPRFEITITGPQNETAQFKTRGKHPVRKVLAAACKIFGIKYERARLILSVSTEEEGEVQTHEFDCPGDETMSQCGVDGNAKLFVRVDANQDDEGYSDEE